MDIMINIMLGCLTVLAVLILLTVFFILVKALLSMWYDIAYQSKEFNERNPIKEIRYSDNKKIEELLRKAMLSQYNDQETKDGWKALYYIVKEYNEITDKTRVSNNGTTNVAGAYFKI